MRMLPLLLVFAFLATGIRYVLAEPVPTPDPVRGAPSPPSRTATSPPRHELGRVPPTPARGTQSSDW